MILKCVLFLHVFDEMTKILWKIDKTEAQYIISKMGDFLWLVMQMHNYFHNKSTKFMTNCQNMNFCRVTFLHKYVISQQQQKMRSKFGEFLLLKTNFLDPDSVEVLIKIRILWKI